MSPRKQRYTFALVSYFSILVHCRTGENAREAHVDMFDGWRPVPCTYLCRWRESSGARTLLTFSQYLTASYFHVVGMAWIVHKLYVTHYKIENHKSKFLAS